MFTARVASKWSKQQNLSQREAHLEKKLTHLAADASKRSSQLPEGV
jgi:hypothetical protein